MKKMLLATAIAALMSTGCSSIVSDSKYNVSIKSNPAGATFSIKNEKGVVVDTGKTPRTVNLNAGNGYFSGEEYTLTFKLDGYDDKNYVLQSGVDGWYFGNIIFGGILGLLIVDPLTGAMFTLPEQVAVDMVSTTAHNNITITTVDQLTDEQKSQLIAVN